MQLNKKFYPILNLRCDDCCSRPVYAYGGVCVCMCVCVCTCVHMVCVSKKMCLDRHGDTAPVRAHMRWTYIDTYATMPVSDKQFQKKSHSFIHTNIHTHTHIHRAWRRCTHREYRDHLIYGALVDLQNAFVFLLRLNHSVHVAEVLALHLGDRQRQASQTDRESDRVKQNDRDRQRD